MIEMQQLLLKDLGRGGVNEKVKSDEIGNNQSATPDSSIYPLLNVHTDTIGSIVKRKGYTEYIEDPVDVGATTLNKINGLFEYRKFNGNTYMVGMGSNGTTQKIFDFSTPASIADITGSSTFTEDTYFDYAVVADILCITTEDRDTPLKWTGSGNTANLGGSPPAGKYCEEFFNYLLIANTASNPERVYWSDVFDPESHTASDFKRLEAECTGLIKRGDVCFAFTRNSITVIQYTGDSINPFTFQRLDTKVGCISNRSIVNIEGTIYWMAADGYVYRMTNFKPEKLTAVMPITLSRLNKGNFNISCAIHQVELNQYWVAVTKDSSTHNDFIIAYDYINNEVFFYDSMAIKCMANLTNSSGDIKVLFGDNTGRIFLSNNGNADYPAGVESTIAWHKHTKVFDLGSSGMVNRLRKIKCTGSASGAVDSQIDVITDFGQQGGATLNVDHTSSGDLLGSTFILGTSILGRVSDRYNNFDICCNTRYVQFKFYGNDKEEKKIRDFQLYFQTYRYPRVA